MGQWIVNGLSVVSCLECRFMSQVYYNIYIYIYLSYGRHGMAREGITLPSLIGSYSLTTIPVDQHVYMIRWEISFSVAQTSELESFYFCCT